MQTFDIILGAILAGFIINGLRKGFFHEVLGFLGVLGGVLAGVLLAGPICKLISEYFTSIPVVLIYLVAYTVLFVAFYYVTRKLANFLKGASDKLFLGWLNNLMGGVFAGLKGAVILSLAFMALTFVPLDKPLEKYEKKSVLYKPLYHLVSDMYEYLGSPDELPDAIRDIIKKGRERLLEDTLEDLQDDLRGSLD